MCRLPGKMEAYINMLLISSQKYIKIIAKLQNNHHAGSPEVWLNGRLTTSELKKKLHGDW